MSGDRALQSAPADVEIPARDADAADQPREIWPFDRPIPITCTDSTLMEILDLGHSAFYKHKARGIFQFLETRTLEGMPTRYSGHLIARLVRGERDAPAESRQFFAAARRRRERKPARAVAGRETA